MSTVPSGYQAPKTNWQAADIVHPSDFNRIEGNIAFLHDEFIIAGPETARPSPGHAGRLYVATGLAQRIWRDTGSAWELATGVPKGVIQMWSGSLASIPQGWTLCNGGTVTAADGTQMSVPDLRDRFIVGAGGQYNVGATGGAAQVTLTVDQIPSHSHTGSTNSAGAHTHTASTSPAGKHTHTFASYIDNTAAGTNTLHKPHQDAGVDNTPRSGFIGEAGEHTHAVTVQSAGAHSHTVTTNSVGGGQPHENRPPYYALCFIMKL